MATQAFRQNDNKNCNDANKTISNKQTKNNQSIEQTNIVRANSNVIQHHQDQQNDVMHVIFGSQLMNLIFR
jgi:hypothetical protein